MTNIIRKFFSPSSVSIVFKLNINPLLFNTPLYEKMNSRIQDEVKKRDNYCFQFNNEYN